MATAREIITAALRKIAATSSNSVPSAEDIDIGLEALNNVIESKSTTLLNIHQIKPYRFQLEAGRLNYTLGPTGDWVTERPMRLERAKLMLNPIFPDPTVAPVASFSADPIYGESALSVQFTDTSTGDPTSWAWDFEQSGTTQSTERNPIWTYTSVGYYTPALTVSNSIGSDTLERTDLIEVVAPAIQNGINIEFEEWGGGLPVDSRHHIVNANPPLPTKDTTRYHNGTASMLIDGTQWINVGAYENTLRLDGMFTLEFWVYYTGGDVTLCCTAGKMPMDTSYYNSTWALYKPADAGIALFNAGYGTLILDENPTRIPVNQWSHIVWERDQNDTMWLIINGVTITSNVQSSFIIDPDYIRIGGPIDVEGIPTSGVVGNIDQFILDLGICRYNPTID